MIAADAHLDPRFKAFPNLPEDDYASILAVPILARDTLEGALNVRTREPRAFTQAEVDLLMTIAGQVAQSIEHAKLYAQAQRRVHELEALARISEAVSESLYLEESLEAIVQTTVESTHATGAAVVLEDGRIAWPEGRSAASGSMVSRSPRAIRSCSSTRSRPVTSSVTGCSTCRRVFISMK
jgi:signal transduction protein with GAF and PtsI domain